MERDGVKTLVIGGTGPTGPSIVNGLVDRGHEVTILHTGRHEVDTIPADLEHIHTDPFDEEQFVDSIAGRNFDLVFAMYGRLRSIAKVLVGRTPRLFSIGGIPVYRGFGDFSSVFPHGMRVPSREDDDLAGPESAPKIAKIIESEQLVFDLHPDATHFRYPYIYGPNQVLPREWPLVKRALDKRPHVILSDSGRTLFTSIYAENVAHAVLLAVDKLDISAGQSYNVSDDYLFDYHQLAQIVADELDHEWDIVSLPYELARPALPMIQNDTGSHRVVSHDKIRAELGYRDKIDPEVALRSTIRWQVENLANDPDGVTERLQDPFDYAAEDRLVESYRRFAAEAGAIDFAAEPGYTFGYYGPRDNPGGTRGSFRG